jgi:hypothetical protein
VFLLYYLLAGRLHLHAACSCEGLSAERLRPITARRAPLRTGGLGAADGSIFSSPG